MYANNCYEQPEGQLWKDYRTMEVASVCGQGQTHDLLNFHFSIILEHYQYWILTPSLTPFSFIPFSLSCIYQCLRPPYGVAYLATKKNYVGFNSAARHLRGLVDEEGIFGAHLVKEMTDRDVWKFFLKWTKLQFPGSGF